MVDVLNITHNFYNSQECSWVINNIKYIVNEDKLKLGYVTMTPHYLNLLAKAVNLKPNHTKNKNIPIRVSNQSDVSSHNDFVLGTKEESQMVAMVYLNSCPNSYISYKKNNKNIKVKVEEGTLIMHSGLEHKVVGDENCTRYILGPFDISKYPYKMVGQFAGSMDNPFISSTSVNVHRQRTITEFSDSNKINKFKFKIGDIDHRYREVDIDKTEKEGDNQQLTVAFSAGEASDSTRSASVALSAGEKEHYMTMRGDGMIIDPSHFPSPENIADLCNFDLSENCVYTHTYIVKNPIFFKNNQQIHTPNSDIIQPGKYRVNFIDISGIYLPPPYDEYNDIVYLTDIIPVQNSSNYKFVFTSKNKNLLEFIPPPALREVQGDAQVRENYNVNDSSLEFIKDSEPIYRYAWNPDKWNSIFDEEEEEDQHKHIHINTNYNKDNTNYNNDIKKINNKITVIYIILSLLIIMTVLLIILKK